jgi:hypothetical protein
VKQIRVSAESIWSQSLTERQKTALDGVAKTRKRTDVSQIAYSGIPKLSEKQLAQFRRPLKKLVACAWMPTCSNGFNSTELAIPRASTTFFG